MNSQDYRNLQEAYIGVYDDDIREKLEFESWVNNLLEEGYDLSDYTWDELYENYSQLDEAITSEKGKAKAAEMIAARSTPSGRAKSGQGATVAQIKHIGRSNREGLSGTPMTPTMAKNPVKSASYGGTGNKAARRAGTYSRFGYKESYELYDIILSHLIDEGYADTEQAAEAIMVNMSEEWREDIMEISQKTATRAYASSATGEFEGQDDASDVKRTDRLRGHIERKFGKKAGEDADRHADSTTFGRKDPRTGKRQPKPESRFQNPNKYRTTKDGKMHGQDQNKLKSKLERRRGED